MKRTKKTMETLNPIEKLIAYAIVGLVSAILMFLWACVVLYLRNAGRAFLCFVVFIGVPSVVAVISGLIDHFWELNRRKEEENESV